MEVVVTACFDGPEGGHDGANREEDRGGGDEVWRMQLGGWWKATVSYGSR